MRRLRVAPPGRNTGLTDQPCRHSPIEPQRATALLDAAGVRQADLQAERDKPPARLRFTCILPEGFPLWEKIGLLAQRDFSAIGVAMKLEAVSVQEFNTQNSVWKLRCSSFRIHCGQQSKPAIYVLVFEEQAECVGLSE